MANKTLFKTIVGKLLPKSDALNEENAPAYKLDTKHALAQFAATGCMNATFYASAETQLVKVLELCEKVEPEFIARTALYARNKGYMKDLPALLCAVLSVRNPGLLEIVFDRVINSPKMLRNFVQIMRSGVVGRKSLGSLPKRLILKWLESRSDEQIFYGSVGNDPSMADIVKMVHPRPATASRESLYGYLIGRDYNYEVLPKIIREFERFKADGCGESVPDVPFQMLTGMELDANAWKAIAHNASWQMTRMNLNTFQRHGVLNDRRMVNLVADRLDDETLVRRAKVFPYQLLVAYINASNDVPSRIREALQDAMDISLSNVPSIDGKVYVFPDVSGSMHSSVTGYRRGSTSAVRCIDVAALVAAAILRKNPNAEVIPFESDVVSVRLNPRDSVMTNAEKLANLPQGGTNCSAPLRFLNRKRATGDLVIYVSDNESWIDTNCHGRFGGSPTETMRQWADFKARSPKAKMVCIDIQPYDTVQAKEREDIVNVAGFSDQVFNLISDVARGGTNENYWVRLIESEELS